MSLFDASAFAVAAHTLDELSGTRADQINGYDLAVTGTVGAVAGKFGSAADFNLLGSLDAGVNIGFVNKLMFRCWAKVGVGCPQFANIASMGAGAAHGVALNWDLDHFNWNIRGSSIHSLSTLPGSGIEDEWTLLHMWFDDVANEIGICVNAGTPVTQAVAFTPIFGAPFRIGNGPTGTNPFKGTVDDMVVLSGYILDADEKTEDWNGGSGLPFAQWDEEESSGSSMSSSSTTHIIRPKRHWRIGPRPFMP